MKRFCNLYIANYYTKKATNSIETNSKQHTDNIKSWDERVVKYESYRYSECWSKQCLKRNNYTDL